MSGAGVGPPTGRDARGRRRVAARLVTEMRMAVRRGDVDQLHTLLDGADATLLAVRALRSIARRFDVGALQSVLSDGETSP